ncbi:MAG: 4-(cytidine 5'-diphospho)-2-C-methyl-D-erythritol kinase [Gammaproteobacteria bacterium]|nr:4-(cytidine 5'-diphospho)-2-C-methyl-D-erythritol kinase [Gammaproteobacteria bacterium]
MTPTTFPCPAKLNLFLHITGRRADGYHELQTVFQILDYGDELTVSVDDSGELVLETPVPGVPDEHNLVMRAARLLQAHAGTKQGARLSLDKRLPMGGGLGGGSSDAATTLVALNRLWACGLSEDELAALGLSLGADVPVFVRGRSCWAEGVGERIVPVQVPESWYLVLMPDCHVSTAEVFGDKDLTRNSAPITMRAFLDGQGRNDCEAVVCRHYPAVAEALSWLSQFAPARMTGTGACIFAAFSNEEEARRIAALHPPGVGCLVAKGVDISPLYR